MGSRGLPFLKNDRRIPLPRLNHNTSILNIVDENSRKRVTPYDFLVNVLLENLRSGLNTHEKMINIKIIIATLSLRLLNID